MSSSSSLLITSPGRPIVHVSMNETDPLLTAMSMIKLLLLLLLQSLYLT